MLLLRSWPTRVCLVCVRKWFYFPYSIIIIIDILSCVCNLSIYFSFLKKLTSCKFLSFFPQKVICFRVDRCIFVYMIFSEVAGIFTMMYLYVCKA